MVLDQLMQTFGVKTRHVPHHIDAAVAFEVAGGMVPALVQLLFLGYRLKFNHRHVATFSEIAFFIKHIGDTARHAGSEVPPGLAEHNDDTARHIFAAMIARAFDDGNRARIANRKSLACHTTEITFARDRAIKHGVADNDRFMRHNLGCFSRRIDDQLATRQSLADIVIGLAFKL